MLVGGGNGLGAAVRHSQLLDIVAGVCSAASNANKVVWSAPVVRVMFD